MKRAGFRLIVVLLLGMTLLQNVGNVAAVNDTTPPVFQSVSVSPLSISAGASVTVTAHITDDSSGVKDASIGYKLPSGGNGPQGSFALVSGTPQDGSYQAIVTIPASYASGTYHLQFAYGEDNASNYAFTYSPPLIDAPFTVGNAAPVLTRLNPSSIPAGGDPFYLTVLGSNFQSGATIYLNGSPRTTTFVSPTQLTASITAADIANPGSATVAVTNPDGQGALSTLTFTISVPPPQVLSVSPESGPATGGTAVTITGKYFQLGATVTFGGVAATNVVVVSFTQITAVTPAYTGGNVLGSVSVTVRNTDGMTGTGGSFDYSVRPGPVIPGVQPNAEPVTRGGPTNPGQQPSPVPTHR